MTISHQNYGAIGSIAQWFETAKPEETRTVRDIQVQTGVHFEEVNEMLQEIRGLDLETTELLDAAKNAMHALAEHFKKSSEVVFMVEQNCHERYLDSLCDQLVTATGVAHFMGYQIELAIAEVDSSNWSKFVIENGRFVCVKDENGKIAKGPNYFKADLSKFV